MEIILNLKLKIRDIKVIMLYQNCSFNENVIYWNKMIKRLKQNQVLPQLVSVVLLIFFSVVLVNLVNLDYLKEKAFLLLDSDGFWGLILFTTGIILLYVLLFLLAWIGADWATRFQYGVMGILALALASFFIKSKDLWGSEY